MGLIELDFKLEFNYQPSYNNNNESSKQYMSVINQFSSHFFQITFLLHLLYVFWFFLVFPEIIFFNLMWHKHINGLNRFSYSKNENLVSQDFLNLFLCQVAKSYIRAYTAFFSITLYNTILRTSIEKKEEKQHKIK